MTTSNHIPRARRVLRSEKLQSFHMPSPGCRVTCPRVELIALPQKVLKNLNATAHPRPFACVVPVQLAPFLLHQPPQDLDAALERRVVHQVALVDISSLGPQMRPRKTRQDLEGVADPLKPTQSVPRHLPALPQLQEAVCTLYARCMHAVQLRLHLLPEVLLLLSEEPAGHRQGEQVVLLDVLVEDLLPQLGRQAPKELLVLASSLAHKVTNSFFARALLFPFLALPNKRMTSSFLNTRGSSSSLASSVSSTLARFVEGSP
eukprot:CAMPEP_0198462322 /NCGR_PEP_ID=MMETSP1456-20131121/826_1 /TAXON_ID=1461544 ORGANISM="Unidentified sp., Strain RCC1871" /NCGR_SAMPLE_ID=MMETSP1456 /ASSEMBLY_ACC=CAM_ASM_001119 /LENGTH=260 /DNA_ID=CAMNT_0044187507 /DNA_START=41 /DNA_END=821 /DNA_ORIENTATION=+